MPCLKGAGHPVQDVPSRESFIDLYTRRGYLWTPTRDLPASVVTACGGELPMEIFIDHGG